MTKHDWLFTFGLVCLSIIIHFIATECKKVDRYNSEIRKIAAQLHDTIILCNSFAAWVHWKQMVIEFRYKYPGNPHLINMLRDALIWKAHQLTGINYAGDEQAL